MKFLVICCCNPSLEILPIGEFTSREFLIYTQVVKRRGNFFGKSNLVGRGRLGHELLIRFAHKYSRPRLGDRAPLALLAGDGARLRLSNLPAATQNKERAMLRITRSCFCGQGET